MQESSAPHHGALLIDLDGVLRRWPADDAPIELSCGLPIGSLRRVAFAPDLLGLAITGVISDDAWRARAVRALQREVPAAKSAEAVARWSSRTGVVDESTLSVLRACRQSLRLVLVTNATTRLPGDLRRLGLSSFFHAVVNSSEIGVAKPDVAIFRVALERAGTTAEEALFVDDSAGNVRAAAALGMSSHAFVDHVGLLTFLRAAGVVDAGD